VALFFPARDEEEAIAAANNSPFGLGGSVYTSDIEHGAGNVLLVKHSSSVPQCALAFQQLFTDAGAPCGVYTNLFASNDQVGRLLDDPRTKLNSNRNCL